MILSYESNLASQKVKGSSVALRTSKKGSLLAAFLFSVLVSDGLRTPMSSELGLNGVHAASTSTRRHGGSLSGHPTASPSFAHQHTISNELKLAIANLNTSIPKLYSRLQARRGGAKQISMKPVSAAQVSAKPKPKQQANWAGAWSVRLNAARSNQRPHLESSARSSVAPSGVISSRTKGTLADPNAQKQHLSLALRPNARAISPVQRTPKNLTNTLPTTQDPFMSALGIESIQEISGGRQRASHPSANPFVHQPGITQENHPLSGNTNELDSTEDLALEKELLAPTAPPFEEAPSIQASAFSSRTTKFHAGQPDEILAELETGCSKNGS